MLLLFPALHCQNWRHCYFEGVCLLSAPTVDQRCELLSLTSCLFERGVKSRCVADTMCRSGAKLCTLFTINNFLTIKTIIFLGFPRSNGLRDIWEAFTAQHVCVRTRLGVIFSLKSDFVPQCHLHVRADKRRERWFCHCLFSIILSVLLFPSWSDVCVHPAKCTANTLKTCHRTCLKSRFYRFRFNLFARPY